MLTEFTMQDGQRITVDPKLVCAIYEGVGYTSIIFGTSAIRIQEYYPDVVIAIRDGK